MFGQLSLQAMEEERDEDSVLVVDDDESVRTFVADVLTNECGLAVTATVSVESARDILSADRFDLIITDIIMAGDTGLDLLRWAGDVCPDIPFVVMTGHAETDYVVDALNAGAHSFLKKPFRPDELTGVVESALSQRRYARMQDRFQRELTRTNSLLRQRVIDALVEHESLFLGALEALAKVIDARDPYTQEHSSSVARLARRTAEQLGLSSAEQEVAETAGMLHDIGKIAVPEAILLKPGKLTEEEMNLMKEHPGRAADILGHVPGLEQALDGVRTHHERFGGGGYPAGIAGEEIPQMGRILAVCDTWDAMTTDRPYRKALSPKTARAILEEIRGEQLDPHVVDVFLQKVLPGLEAEGADKRPSQRLAAEHRARRRLAEEERDRRAAPHAPVSVEASAPDGPA